MSISKTQLYDFASYVNNHEALEEFIKRVDAKMFDEFTRAESDEARIKVGNKYDAFTDLIGDIKLVFDEMMQIKKQKEEDDDDNPNPAGKRRIRKRGDNSGR